MSRLIDVPAQALSDELRGWESALEQELKKCKANRPISARNRLLGNSLQITITQIDSQLLLYRKTKEKLQRQGGNSAIADYNYLSTRFMDLMVKISNVLKDLNQQADDTPPIYPQAERKTSKKGFLDDTFAFVVSKKQKVKLSSKGNISVGFQKQTRRKISKEEKTRQIWGQGQSEDVRGQLREIKAMMREMQSEVRFHNHSQLQGQINRIQQGNKKMALQLRTFKDNHQFAIGRIQALREELTKEKETQTKMLQAFEEARNRNRTNLTQLSRSRNDRSRFLTEENVSDWVKQRI